jgi:hypothetical protein
MLAAPTRDWSVFPPIFADHWDAFQHTPPRSQPPSDDGLVAQRLACGHPEQMGDLESRGLHCGPGTPLGAMRGKASLG